MTYTFHGHQNCEYQKPSKYACTWVCRFWTQNHTGSPVGWLLAVGCWLFAVCCLLFAVGCWLLAVGWFMFMFLCLYFLFLLITTVVPYLLLLAPHGTHGTALWSKAMEHGRWIQWDSFYSLTHRGFGTCMPKSVLGYSFPLWFCSAVGWGCHSHVHAEISTRIYFSLKWGGLARYFLASCDLVQTRKYQ